MSDTTAAPTTSTPSPDTSAPATGGMDEFSPAEKAYFESKGEKGLGDPTPAPTTQAADKPTEAAPDDYVDGEVSIGADGKPYDKKTGRFVPHGAFQKERTGRTAAEGRVRQLETERAAIDERLKMLSNAFTAEQKPITQAPAVEEKPDPEKDIFAYVRYLEKKIEEGGKASKEATEKITAAQTERDRANDYVRDAQSFARENADFGPAYTHLVQSLDRELEALGYDDPAERKSIITQREKEEIDRARKLGRRPAEHIFKIAQSRGFVAPKKDDPKPEPKPATSDATSKLDALQSAQDSARTLSGAGGGAPVMLTIEAILAMTDEQISAYPKHVIRKVLGG